MQSKAKAWVPPTKRKMSWNLFSGGWLDNYPLMKRYRLANVMTFAGVHFQ